MKKKRDNTDVLIVDASKGFVKEGKNNKLRASDIRRIADVVRDRKTIEKFSRLVSQEKIRRNDYNLNIPRYVDSAEPAESYDLYATMFGGVPVHELNAFSKYWQVFPSLKNELFQGDGEYVDLKVTNCKDVIKENIDVRNFVKHFRNSFSDFSITMDRVLIEQATTLSIAKTEDILTADIFQRFADIPLLDRYQAYEIFSKQYEQISGDIELIQSEGMEAVKKVDAEYVTKKRSGRDVTIRESLQGHILSFELVQKACLNDERTALQVKQDELSAIPGEYDELLESLSEEDKDNISEALNENGDAFVIKNIKGVVKELKEDEEENHDLIQTLNKAVALNSREKKLKSEIKNDSIALEEATIEKIQNLSDEEVKQLLHEKWAVSVVNGILSLSDSLLDDFTKKLEALAEKYAETMSDIENEIRETEHSLADMLSELTGPEADMKGIEEFQKLLRGEDDE